MSPQKLESLLDPHLEPGATEHRGLALGLRLGRSIVELHEGPIRGRPARAARDLPPALAGGRNHAARLKSADGQASQPRVEIRRSERRTQTPSSRRKPRARAHGVGRERRRALRSRLSPAVARRVRGPGKHKENLRVYVEAARRRGEPARPHPAVRSARPRQDHAGPHPGQGDGHDALRSRAVPPSSTRAC